MLGALTFFRARFARDHVRYTNFSHLAKGRFRYTKFFRAPREAVMISVAEALNF